MFFLVFCAHSFSYFLQSRFAFKDHCIRNKKRIYFKDVSVKIIQQISKNMILLLIKQTEFWCILSEKLTDLVGLGSNGKAKTFELFSFNFDHMFLKI